MYHVLSIKYKIFKTYFVIALVILTTYYLLHATFPANAQSMGNDSYNIKMENLNTTGSKLIKENPNSEAAQENIAGLYIGANFKVRTGFEYVNSIDPFVFTISQDLADFGTLYPTTPVTRTVNLGISPGSASGYEVIVSEDHALTAASGAIIPDTTCDNGSCSESVSALWANTLTYGFGYRSDNFKEENFYKQFADESKGEAGQTVLSSDTKGSDKRIQITYKVNISGSQTQGSYSNTITYIAVPKF